MNGEKELKKICVNGLHKNGFAWNPRVTSKDNVLGTRVKANQNVYPQAKAQALGKEGRATAARRKRKKIQTKRSRRTD
jgi:hypothetical protein